ncbi:MAG TPA: hypothetical protein VK742_19735 [Candidatus Sulfotelmatobacter sp.]|nr:hypothetical protein [Candidatus Sulfotelmatobacter sp.]
MNRFFSLFLLATTLTAGAALPQPGLIVRIHFAGGDAVAMDKNYSAFNNEFSSAEALALRRQAADKLAPWLAGWLQAKAGAGTSAENLRPLFDDLQSSEWFFEAHTSAGKPSGYFAIKLDPARLQLWKANLKSAPFEIDDSRGWLFCLFGDTVGKLGDLQIPPPLAGWLECDVNWPELGRWYPGVKALDLPETKFSVSAAAGQFHIIGRFYFLQNLAGRFDPWQIPVNEIHQPLTSFTAVRGFAPWLAGQDWARAWQLSPPANQLFIWSMSGMPFQTFAAVPLNDSMAALNRLYQNLQPALAAENARKRFVDPFKLSLESNRLIVAGAPIVTPEITAQHDPAGDLLFASTFPNAMHGRPLPPELSQALARPNLLYYHWEMTAPRFPALLQYSQLALMLTAHAQMNVQSVASKWAQISYPAPGITTTEITQTAPDQLTFTRNAPAGFTALEFFALASWVDAPEFPHCTLELPSLSERMKMLRAKRMHAQPPGSPAPPQ